MWKFKEPEESKQVQTEKVVELTLPDLTTYYKAIAIRSVVFAIKTKKSMEQYKKPRNKTTHTLTTDIRQSAKAMHLWQRGKESLFNKWWWGSMQKKHQNQNPHFAPFTKISSNGSQT